MYGGSPWEGQRRGELDKMEDFINKMPIKPNNNIWRTVLGACCRANGCKIEIDMLLEMEPQNDVNYMLLANIICDSSSCVFDSLFKTYDRMKKFRNTTDVFCQTKDYAFLPTVESCNKYISSLLDLNRVDIALGFYKEMWRCRISPNFYTLNMVIGAFWYCNKGLLSSAVKLKNSMGKDSLQPNVITFDTFVYDFCKEGKSHEEIKEGKLHEAISEMKSMNVTPNILTYNTLINGFSQTGNSEMGSRLYEEMVRNGIKAYILTYNALILGICKVGKTKNAAYLVKDLNKGNLVPNASTLSALYHWAMYEGEPKEQPTENKVELEKSCEKLKGFLLLVGVFATPHFQKQSTLKQYFTDFSISVYKIVHGDKNSSLGIAGTVYRIRSMFRCLFQSTTKRTLSTVTASPITTHNAIEIPIEASIYHHKTAASLHSSFDVLEHLVSTYRDSRCLKDAKLFHLQTLKLGFHYDTFLCNTLVNIYVRAGDLVSANKLFDEMPDRNSVSRAALISGYTQNGMFSEACGMFREMMCSGFFPNHYAIGSVLRACQEFGPSGLKLGMQIHGLILKSKHAFDVLACNVVISFMGDVRHIVIMLVVFLRI
ncbi:hypothetical protein LWI28_011756 [Acer negundo]|uniref:Pentatricopeptide repeat-containing protein n=1 Tax=Acer negundo TaxID=4023 RepID=A0AAD5IUD8_ACENE|nr:hypothetical protein LWI28_011756 [Acer negundo]